MAAAAVTGLRAPVPVSLSLSPLVFHCDAFVFAMKPVRFDVLYGMATVRPELAARLGSD